MSTTAFNPNSCEEHALSLLLSICPQWKVVECTKVKAQKWTPYIFWPQVADEPLAQITGLVKFDDREVEF
jgi:hypothetical protein